MMRWKRKRNRSGKTRRRWKIMITKTIMAIKKTQRMKILAIMPMITIKANQEPIFVLTYII